MAFEAIKETARQEKLQGKDSNFLKDMLYFFELRVPKSRVDGNRDPTFYFPLVLGPEEITLSEPFALSKTQTQGSGLFVEENGIIERTIRVSGHTGFKPRPFPGSSGFSSIKAPPAGRSHAREIIDPLGEALSGHKHFQLLEDAVFRTYADLKRDPSTSEDTRLFFHMMKDSEHWEVKPQNFNLSRQLDRKMLYPYSFELLIVGPATDPAFNNSEDKDLIDSMKDDIKAIQRAVATVVAALEDIQGVINTINRGIAGFAALINSITSIVDEAANFVNGLASSIAVPFRAVANVIDRMDTALTHMTDSIGQFPDQVIQACRQIQDGLHRLGTVPQRFETSAQDFLSAFRKQENLSSAVPTATLLAAATAAPPNSFQKFLALGTGSMPGDLTRTKSELGIDTLKDYSSTTPHVVQASDTLFSLAAKFLGNARLWKHIAILNNLEHPYISKEGIPGTKKVGDTILLPSNTSPSQNSSTVPLLGVSPEAPSEERSLGVDMKLKRLPGPTNKFDVEIDLENGSTDVKLVRGIPNLVQALEIRLSTERGTDQLYKNVGVDRVVGLPIPSLGPQMVALKTSQAVQADPRISAIRSLDLDQPSPDAVIINMEPEVIGIGGIEPVTLRI